MIPMPEPVSIPVTDKFIQDAAYYARKVVFSSFSNGMRPRFGNGGLVKHMQGKMGELAFFKFCLDNGIPVKHAPFRDDYSALDDQDDFIIVLKSRQIPVEVKTASLKNPIELRTPNLFYNKSQYDQKENYNYIVVFAATNFELTQVVLIGWIPAKKIAKYTVRRDIKSPAYVIPVKDLKPMSDFLKF
jgi:hypothetical protein